MAFRQLAVDDAVAIEEDGAEIAGCGGAIAMLNRLRHAAMIEQAWSETARGVDALIEQLHEVIQEIEHRWSAKRLLVVGDVMLDKYVWGEVGRISPEAPVPVVRMTHRSQQPGGAANVAMNIGRLGAQVEVIGFAGDDEDGRAAGGIAADEWSADGICCVRWVSDDYEAAGAERAAADASPGYGAGGAAIGGRLRSAD